jgi:hypothetical protein
VEESGNIKMKARKLKVAAGKVVKKFVAERYFTLISH